jgi:hypothetical protein
MVLDDEVVAALADRDLTFDYAMDGLRLYAGVFSIWPAMVRAYHRLWEILQL